MFGLGPTIKKLAMLLLFPPLLFFVLNAAGWQWQQTVLLIIAFVAGMIFPDIDVITGLIRTTFQTILLLAFVALAVVAFPTLASHAQPYCPVSQIQSVIPDTDATVACQIGLALLIVAIANGAATLAVIWIPAKDSFHHWTSAILFSGTLALAARVAHLTEHYAILGLGFGIGYGLHILADQRQGAGAQAATGSAGLGLPAGSGGDLLKGLLSK